ncbi:MAG: nucleotidyltransferase [Thermaerobacter sp.]|nr:nucleotidyltransferase [Thermaerobacter sp.]
MLLRTMLEVSDLLAELMVPNCLVGGLAVSAYGMIRGTGDVDFLAILDGDQIDALRQAARKAQWGYKHTNTSIDDPIGDVIELTTPDVVHIIMAKYAYEPDFISRAGAFRYGDHKFNVIAPEDLIILKLRAFGPYDKEDVLAILSTNIPMDFDYLHKMIIVAHISRHWAKIQKMQNAPGEYSPQTALRHKSGERVRFKPKP